MFSPSRSSPADVAALRWGYKKSREFVRRLPLFRGAFPPVAPAFAEDSSAALKDTTTVALDAPNLVYSAEDDKAIDEFHQKFSKCRNLDHDVYIATHIYEIVATTWHSVSIKFNCSSERLTW